MTAKSLRAERCGYCGAKVNLDSSFGQNKVTGKYFHLACFFHVEPRGAEIMEQAEKVAVKCLEEQEKKRTAH